MLQEKARVLWNNNISSQYYNIGIKCSNGFSKAAPGQFIMLGLISHSAPLLRRPFSIHRLITKKNGHNVGIELLYKVVGDCTKKLSEIKEGDFVDILGPLGKGFSFDLNLNRFFFVAGGIGVAPMLFFTSHLISLEADLSRSKIFIGGNTENDLLCVDTFIDQKIEVKISTDDGSRGKKGLITDLLNAAVTKEIPDIIFACGPIPMLRAVAKIAKFYKIPCQISIETIMACGIGACLGCAVESRNLHDRYLHACIDGPVFDSTDLKIF